MFSPKAFETKCVFLFVCVLQIPQDSGDIIVGKAIEIWQKYGSLLMPGASRGDSPNINLAEKGHT